MGLCRGQQCSSGEFQGSYTNRTLYTQGRCVILSQPQEKCTHACMGAHMVGLGCVRVGVWGVCVLGGGRESAYAHNAGYVHMRTHECGGQRTFWPLFSATVHLICESSLSLSQSSPRKPDWLASKPQGSNTFPLPVMGTTGVSHCAQVWATMPRLLLRYEPPCPGVGHHAQLFYLGFGVHFTNRAISKERL